MAESKTQASVDIEEFAVDDRRQGFLGMAAELRRQKRQKEEKNEAEKRKLFLELLHGRKGIKKKRTSAFSNKTVRTTKPSFSDSEDGSDEEERKLAEEIRRRQELLRRKKEERKQKAKERLAQLDAELRKLDTLSDDNEKTTTKKTAPRKNAY